MALNVAGNTAPWPVLPTPTHSAVSSGAVVEAAYREHATALTRFLTGYTRDATAAEDLAQEAFVRLAIEAAAGRAPDNVGAWLHRVGRNLATSRGRHASVAERRKMDLVSRETAPSPEAATLEAEQHRALHAALGTLASTDRQVLLLAAHGYRGPEIARRIGRTEGATRTLLCRARSKVRTQLVAIGGA
jgi:RNA polymerase sigma-70 factor (ECF subfamily)